MRAALEDEIVQRERQQGKWMTNTSTIQNTHARALAIPFVKDFKFEIMLFNTCQFTWNGDPSFSVTSSTHARLQTNGTGLNGTFERHWNYYYKVSEGITDLSLNRFICHFMRRIFIAHSHTHCAATKSNHGKILSFCEIAWALQKNPAQIEYFESKLSNLYQHEKNLLQNE